MKTLIGVLGFSIALAAADVVQCENGDRYTGRVLLVNETDVRLLNDIQGAMTIPRAKVLSIQFDTPGRAARTNAPAADAGLKLDAAAIDQVQQQFLSGANPEANQMFQEMIQGLASGKLDVADIRAKASETIEEVRKLQQELGEDDTADLLNSYVGILENFLRAASNTPPVRATPAPKTPKVLDPEE